MTRCAICGKKLALGSDVFSITKGKLVDNDLAKRESWGTVHDTCFVRALPTKEAALSQIESMLRVKR